MQLCFDLVLLACLYKINTLKCFKTFLTLLLDPSEPLCAQLCHAPVHVFACLDLLFVPACVSLLETHCETRKISLTWAFKTNRRTNILSRNLIIIFSFKYKFHMLKQALQKCFNIEKKSWPLLDLNPPPSAR